MKDCAHRYCKKKFTPKTWNAKFCCLWCGADHFGMTRPSYQQQSSDWMKWYGRRRRWVKGRAEARAKERAWLNSPAGRPRITRTEIQAGPPEKIIKLLDRWTRCEYNYGATMHLTKARA